MNKISIFTGTLVVGAVLAAGSVMAQQATSIKDTPHNLGALGPGPNRYTNTSDTCVFCHTPHGSDTSAPVALWNRKLRTDVESYFTYDQLGTSTLDGKVASVGSVSLACLSCHDGTQAMNVVLNAPGSGGYDPDANPFQSQPGWTGPAASASPYTGSLGYNSIVNLGLNLKNDHPVGIQYGGGGQDTANPSGAFKDKDFRNTANEVIGGTRIWWVDTPGVGTAGVREKTDMLLYTRVGSGGSFGAGGGNPEPLVECGSCHDPHMGSTAPGQQVHFLRISNANSAVCLACHIK